MALRDYVFILTQGEGLLNEFTDFLKIQIQKILNLHNRLRRKSKIKHYYKTHSKIKIQFGSGIKNVDGFLNTDVFGKIPVNITKKLPFPSETVDLIFSCHVIEHIYNRQFKIYLKEVYRVLKKEGIQIIMTPSLTKIIDVLYYQPNIRSKYIENHMNLPDNKKLGGLKLDSATFLNRMMHICYQHKFIYDFESIYRLAKKTGYSIIKSISISEIPDELLRNHCIPLNNKFGFYTETETFLLIK